MATVGMKLEMEGAAQYKADLQQITQRSKELASEMQSVVSGANDEASKIKVLNSQMENQQKKIELLNQKYSAQEKQLDELNKELDKAKKEYGENSEQAQKLVTEITKQETAMSKTRTELNKAETEYNQAAKAVDNMGDETKETAEETDKAEASFANVGAAVGKVATAVTAAAAAIGAAAVAAAKQVWDMATEVATAGDEIDKESQKLGMTAQSYQELSYAMEMSGSSISDLSKGSIKITNALADTANGVEGADDAFKALGIRLKKADGSMKTTDEVLLESIDALANMKDETQRNAAAQDIFGKSAKELAPLLNEGADGIHALMQEAEDYGMVMSDEAVKASADFDDSLTRLKGTVNGVKQRFMTVLLPSLTKVTDGFSLLASGSEEGSKMMFEGIKEALDEIDKLLPDFITLAGDVIAALLQGLGDNLPSLVDTFVGMFDKLVEEGTLSDIITKLVGAIPKIINSVFDAVETIIDTMDLGELVTTVFDCLNSIITSILPRIPELLIKLIAAVIEALPELFVGVGETIYNIFDSLFGAYDEFAGFNSDLAEHKTAWDNVTDALANAKDEIERDASKWQENWELLQSITDETGKVKDGYGALATELANELNDELGTNIEIIKGQVQGYQDLCDEIDNLIVKKRAELILEAEEAAYSEALAQRPALISDVNQAEKNLTKAQEKLAKAQDEYNKLAESGGENLADYENAITNAQLEVAQMSDALGDAKTRLGENTSVMTQYMNDYTAVMTGDYNQLGDVQKQFTGDTLEELKQYGADVQEQLDQDKLNYSAWLQSYKDTNSDYAKEQAAYYEARIKEDEDKLAKINGIVEKGGADFDAAYAKGLLTDAYKVTNAASSVGDSAVTSANRYDSFYTLGGQASAGFAAGMGDKGYLVTNAAYNLANAAKWKMQNTLEIASPSKVMEKIGGFFSAGFAEGITDKAQSAVRAASALAVNAANAGAGAMSHTNNTINATINVNAAAGQSANDIAEAVAEQLQNLLDRRTTVYA